MGRSETKLTRQIGKQECRKINKQIKLDQKENYEKFYDSFAVTSPPHPAWRCTACIDSGVYSRFCMDDLKHQEEWVTQAKEHIRDDIRKAFFKSDRGTKEGRTKNGKQIASKCFSKTGNIRDEIDYGLESFYEA